MIKTEDGRTEVIALTAEEVAFDTQNVITAFIKFSKKTQVPEKVIEETLVKMIANGFNRGAELIDLTGYFGEEEKGE